MGRILAIIICILAFFMIASFSSGAVGVGMCWLFILVMMIALAIGIDNNDNNQ